MSQSTRVLVSALLVAAWLGAALITVAVVAPGAFAVLPSRTIAGTMVGRVLPALFIAGMVIGIAVASMAGGASRWAAATAVLSALACVISQFVITPRIERLRAEIAGPVDVLPIDDARRVAFGLLHGYNVAGLGVAMLGAAVCLGVLLFSMRSRA
jgi:Domain of unknown function (DUF4149)